MKTLLLRLSRQDALKYGLLVCKHCGYPPNNHFNSGRRLCAHTRDCPGYEEASRVGELVSE